ncbi:MAG: DASH family cryptochrome [Saprospiraceae bacterium]|uniref:Cryptochrome DASH n=1 Tax=Candidatus Opimibacter skivensis TaxID=2982028 RepID=A0A9D7XQH4_9BACT|nr:DASH family cryptochrome [Candidatus Opimibacter skivensis]
MVRSILWFRQDLRLHDNEALQEAIRSSDELMPIFIFNPKDFKPKTIYGTPKTGISRVRFLVESIIDLRKNLRNMGSDLIVRVGDPEKILYDLAILYHINWVYCNRERTREEVNVQDRLEKKLWTIGREVRYSRGKMLFYTSDLPFPVTHCPDSFTNFKKETEQIIYVRAPLETPERIPPFSGEIEPGEIPELLDLINIDDTVSIKCFIGGETAGLEALSKYGLNDPPSSVITDGTSLSPWLSMGCLSPKKVFFAAPLFKSGGHEVQQYLVYRDYLRLMGKKYGDRIFYRSGIKGFPIQTRNDPDTLLRWQQGLTGVTIIDAAMHQLNMTGWLPDQLRRLVAGYYLKVLNLDWRVGAAYFESKVVDYDPCSNWVSWLNLAGLGPDTRDDRIINYDAVGKRLDPDGQYVNTWTPQLSS